MSLIKEVIAVAQQIKNGRDTKDIAIKLAEESGEVLGAVSIITGLSSYKKIERTDLCDELVDVFINVVDLGINVYGEEFEELFKQRVKVKADKWIEKYNKQRIS